MDVIVQWVRKLVFSELSQDRLSYWQIFTVKPIQRFNSGHKKTRDILIDVTCIAMEIIEALSWD